MIASGQALGQYFPQTFRGHMYLAITDKRSLGLSLERWQNIGMKGMPLKGSMFP
jgi:hypothetical protein